MVDLVVSYHVKELGVLGHRQQHVHVEVGLFGAVLRLHAQCFEELLDRDAAGADQF